ncbi:MAG: phosphate ABC transporter ATP-binding protein PstB [Treponema sp.]|nr:phosphate ABC transporter ATP-binding protein PstB [Treponema sp.]
MSDTQQESGKNIKIKLQSVNLYYGTNHALGDLNFEIPACSIIAIIGPSGCGKSSLLRLFNRMNDLIPGTKVEGDIILNDSGIYGKDTDVVLLRQKVGMVFQKPNVFPMSIYANITTAPRRHGVKNKKQLAAIAEHSLTQVGLWDEVKDILNRPAQGLATGQQQRLCIARSLAVEPEVILMDESCSALDPESTMEVEELMLELAAKYTIIIVTHNMEQARRVSDMSAFMMIDDKKIGRLVEYAPTSEMFIRPKDVRTEDYISGRYG